MRLELLNVTRDYLTRDTFSPEQLKRELQSISAGYESQSMPVFPCRLPLTYFPPSMLLLGSPVEIYYLQK